MPLVSETAAAPRNGLKVASTFSGCGGSCYGYRLAGYEVVWANEFVPIAQESYKANHPTSVLDGRDIKTVQPEDILAATGLRRGELNLFDGSPPCQAFSTQGKREKGWGTDRVYEHGARQRNEDLFFEYVRLLDGLQPEVFVAENVSGLVKGTAKGYFKLILAALQKCGYRVEARLLDAQWLGVPQSRQRIIFIGVRNDLQLDPVFPAPLPYRYGIADALPELVGAQLARDFNRSADACGPLSPDKPHPTITATENPFRVRPQVIRDSGGAHAAGAVNLNGPAPTIPADRPATFQVRQSLELDTGGTRLHGPIQPELPVPTITTQGANHFKVRARFVARQGFAAGSIYQPDEPSPIVTAGGIAGSHRHAVYVEDPANQFQARQLTIPEVMRLCSFPDDYQLKGSFNQQWERMGNSVPPVMMQQIAATLRDQVFARISR